MPYLFESKTGLNIGEAKNASERIQKIELFPQPSELLYIRDPHGREISISELRRIAASGVERAQIWSAGECRQNQLRMPSPCVRSSLGSFAPEIG